MERKLNYNETKQVWIEELGTAQLWDHDQRIDIDEKVVKKQVEYVIHLLLHTSSDSIFEEE